MSLPSGEIFTPRRVGPDEVRRGEQPFQRQFLRAMPAFRAPIVSSSASRCAEPRRIRVAPASGARTRLLHCRVNFISGV